MVPLVNYLAQKLDGEFFVLPSPEQGTQEDRSIEQCFSAFKKPSDRGGRG